MQFGVLVLAAVVLLKMFACCEVVPSGFVGLLWGMVCREWGHGWVHFLLPRLSMLFSLRACVCCVAIVICSLCCAVV